MEAHKIDLAPDAPIHALRTRGGAFMFSMSEIAVELFHDNPGAFGKEMRRGRYKRMRVLDPVVLLRLAQLCIPPESITVVGATLLPPDSLFAILQDRRRPEIIPKVRIALLKLVSKDASDLIARGQFDDALPIVMDAILKGQALFYPTAPLQLVPIYLLAVQVNLGMGRQVQSEDLLGVGSWLLLQDTTDQPKDSIRAELSRLFGQLLVLQKHPQTSFKAFAEEIYYKSQEYGVFDVRTSIGFYNLSKVFYSTGHKSHSMAFWDLVIHTWMAALKEVVLHVPEKRLTAWGKPQHPGAMDQPLETNLAIEKLQMDEVCDMLQDICTHRAEANGAKHVSVAEACLVLSLAFMHCQKKGLALEHLQNAQGIYNKADDKSMLETVASAMKVVLGSATTLQQPSSRTV